MFQLHRGGRFCIKVGDFKNQYTKFGSKCYNFLDSRHTRPDFQKKEVELPYFPKINEQPKAIKNSLTYDYLRRKGVIKRLNSMLREFGDI